MRITPLAAGSVDTAGVFTGTGGTFTRISAGIFELTMDQGVDVLAAQAFATVGASEGEVSIQHVSTTVKRFHTFPIQSITHTDRAFVFSIGQLNL